MSTDSSKHPIYLQSPSETPRQRGWGCLILGVLGISCVSAMLCCGLAGGGFYWAMQVYAQEVQRELAKNSVIREHLGELHSISMDWSRSFSEANDVYAFNVEGQRGSGYVVVTLVTDAQGHEEIRDGTLRFPDGRTLPLVESSQGTGEQGTDEEATGQQPAADPPSHE